MRRFRIIVGAMMSLVSSLSAALAPAVSLTLRMTASQYNFGSPHTNVSCRNTLKVSLPYGTSPTNNTRLPERVNESWI
ncbi:hypothetical protein PF010_g7512 [Phytophthora fragariae]|uniref:Secreted protein n=2 Tax=Phytophthora fragariae TaxID=53985 RepID=A0A6A3EN52_9STRA|nr:hypothetical protein PF003_g35303 [Phytophthora fragariae]KAE8934885.1 hypothetical protein PF009_g15142 [Phytophthora fragariae]KAE9012463.1 hypothetical protein PF011_g8902 [Phytophthora fragariae]KAE9120378.1 hypothetical protein PF010_g7512 [Phytophthora fragariae]KAE9143688.1 hypothetical protein PF006_g11305 [Phytophthora fragariae]